MLVRSLNGVNVYKTHREKIKIVNIKLIDTELYINIYIILLDLEHKRNFSAIHGRALNVIVLFFVF